MGTYFVPVYGTLTIGYFEEQSYNIINISKHTENDFRWMFYSLDEKSNRIKIISLCFKSFTWRHSDFSLQYSQTEQIVFDVMIQTKKRWKTETDIFYKATDSKQYLLFSSCHPRHIKQNIPVHLAWRLWSIVSEQQRLEERMILFGESHLTLARGGFGEKYIDETGNQLRKKGHSAQSTN